MNYLPKIFDCKVAVIGLGYVGLPLTIELSKNNKCLKTNKNLSRKIIGFRKEMIGEKVSRAGLESLSIAPDSLKVTKWIANFIAP